MEVSYFLAQLLGLAICVISLAAVLRPEAIIKAIEEMKGESFGSLLAGAAGVIAGMAIVLTHNIWEPNWKGLITFFGWAAVLKGALYIAAPQSLVALANKVMGGKTQLQMILLIYFALGAYLAFKGFGY